MKTHYVQKAAQSHISAGATMPVREVQAHENYISWNDDEGLSHNTISRAWYVRTEDGKLHGQFHTEAEANLFAATH